jgi:hypothetical protein
MQLTQELDKQVQNLIQKGYHTVAGLTEKDFSKHFEPLRKQVEKLDLPECDFEKGYLPFVVVVQSNLVPTDTAMSLVEKDGKTGVTKLFPHQPSDFSTISAVTIPTSKIYLLIDIDRGKENINQPPSEAMKKIEASGQSPLTIDEGVAIVTQYPEFLIKNNCFSLLASRHDGDQRVPAIWINGSKNPNLGWCWNGNPHTWLGSASCKERIG